MVYLRAHIESDIQRRSALPRGGATKSTSNGTTDQPLTMQICVELIVDWFDLQRAVCPDHFCHTLFDVDVAHYQPIGLNVRHMTNTCLGGSTPNFANGAIRVLHDLSFTFTNEFAGFD